MQVSDENAVMCNLESLVAWSVSAVFIARLLELNNSVTFNLVKGAQVPPEVKKCDFMIFFIIERNGSDSWFFAYYVRHNSYPIKNEQHIEVIKNVVIIKKCHNYNFIIKKH